MTTLTFLKYSNRVICPRKIQFYSHALSSSKAFSERNNYSTKTGEALSCRKHSCLWSTSSNKLLNVVTSVTSARYDKFSTKSTNSESGNNRKALDEAAKAANQKEIEDAIIDDSGKLGLFARFKLMYKKYWYVLIPVHVVTSIGWLAGFYYLSKSGVDVPSLLQYIHLSETIIQKVQNSDMGHYAIAYLCYKVATPLRYAVTLGGTTVSIKFLVQAGHIKPVPTKKEFIQMYEDKKADRAKRKQEREDEK